MRTTLTIDEDVAAMLEQLRRDRKTSLKALINEALRCGLLEIECCAETTEALSYLFSWTSIRLGVLT